MLKIVNLNAGYQDLRILKNINLELEKGSISLLMGPNGAGKSTLLKSIFNLTHIFSGQVKFGGIDITGFPAYKLLGLRIAYVPQGRVNFNMLSVRDNLLMGAHNIKDSNYIEEKIQEIYGQFPVLKEKRKHLAYSLSGGQQQMLAIGRALMCSPRLLLLDEPSLGLSPKLVKDVFSDLLRIRDYFGVTILIVEHNLKSLMDIADYGYVLVQGKIVAHGKCFVLKESEIMRKIFVGVLD